MPCPFSPFRQDGASIACCQVARQAECSSDFDTSYSGLPWVLCSIPLHSNRSLPPDFYTLRKSSKCRQDLNFRRHGALASFSKEHKMACGISSSQSGKLWSNKRPACKHYNFSECSFLLIDRVALQRYHIEHRCLLLFLDVQSNEMAETQH